MDLFLENSLMVQRILVTGASGLLGGYILAEAAQRQLPLTGWSSQQGTSLFGIDCVPVDLRQPKAVSLAFATVQPTHVLHAAARSSIMDCFQHPARAEAVNVAGTHLLAELCQRHGTRLLYVSTDLVFDGEHGGYGESDTPHPLSVYGRTKRQAELAVLQGTRNLVVRVSWLVGPSLSGRPTFFQQMLSALRTGQPLTLFTDEWRTPLGLPVAARVLLELLESDLTGLLHLGGSERLSRYDMGLTLAHYLGMDPGPLRQGIRAEVPAPEPRPRDVSLDSSRWRGHFPQQVWPGFAETLRLVL